MYVLGSQSGVKLPILLAFWLAGSLLATNAWSQPDPGEAHERFHLMDGTPEPGTEAYQQALDTLRNALDQSPNSELEFAWKVHNADHANTRGQFHETVGKILPLIENPVVSPQDRHLLAARRVVAEAKLASADPVAAITLLKPVLEAASPDDPMTIENLNARLVIAESRLALADYSGALTELLELLTIPKLAGSQSAPARRTYLIGKTYERMGDGGSAAFYYEQALKELDQITPKPPAQGLIVINLRLGEVELAAGNVESATERFKLAYQYAVDNELSAEASYAQYELALAALAAGELDRALELGTAAHDAVAASQNRTVLARASQLLGRVQLARERPLLAIPQFQEAVDIYRNQQSKERTAEATEWLAKAQFAAGDTEDAWRSMLSAMDEFRGFAADRESSQTSRLRSLFAADQAEAETLLLKKDNDLKVADLERRTAWAYTQTIVSVTLLAMLAMAGLLLWRQKRYQRRLTKLANTDSLTGLLNYRRIHEAGDRMTSRAWHESEPLSVIAADIDDFKAVNDTYGHDAGDRVIQRVAAALSAGLREGDRAGRLGGEEFLLVLPGSRAEGAALVAERIRSSVECGDGGEFGESIPVTVSFGVAELSEAHGNFLKLLKTADERLYRAKKQGRNQVVGGRGSHLSSV